MPTKLRLEYHLPVVGHLTATLHDESAQLFQCLNGSDEIKRFKSIPQLGVVSEAWPGARHTRWDYIVLLLHLIDVCKAQTTARLNSVVELPTHQKVSSGQELLACWSLLLQTGHQYWTFTTERILLELIAKKVHLRSELLNSIATKAVRTWAAQVLDGADYYHFHQILAYYRLPKTIRDPKVRAKAAAMLDAYILSPGSESLQQARRVFQSLRRLAFLALDAEYSPSALSLRLDRILRDPSSLERLVLNRANTPTELDGLDRYLVENVYLGERVLLAVAQRENAIRARIAPALANSDLRYVTEELARQNFPTTGKQDTALRAVVRLIVETTWLRDASQQFLNTTLQKRRAYGWAKRQQTRFHLSYECDAKRDLIVFQAHAREGEDLSAAAAIGYGMRYLTGILEDLARRFPTQDSRAQEARLALQHLILNRPGESLLLAALHFLAPLEYWEFTVPDPRSRVTWILDPRHHAIDRTLLRLGRVPDFRLHEVESTLRTISHVGVGPALVSLSNIKMYSSGQDSPSAEIDGLAMYRDKNRRQVVMVILEAKEQRRQAEATARKALRQITKRIPLRATVGVGRIYSQAEGRKARAWRYIRIPYARS